jgi:REP element-mobilizing transposase RayT
MKSRYKVVESDGVYFTTSTIVEWIPIFTNENTFQIITNSLNYCINENMLKIYSFVIMPNHLHLIVSAKDLSESMKSFKRHTAKKVLEYLKKSKHDWILNQMHFFKKRNKLESEYQVWQEGFHPQLISSNKMLEQKTNYNHQNPVRKGFVNEAEYWKYSSASNKDFEGNEIIKLNSLDDLKVKLT